jgi:hypothetical protein
MGLLKSMMVGLVTGAAVFGAGLVGCYFLADWGLGLLAFVFLGVSGLLAIGTVIFVARWCVSQ